MFLQRILPSLATLVLLAACAISPQQVAIDPASDETFPSADRSGIVVNLSVTDTRSESAFGTLGGTYDESATLTASNDIAADLRALLRGKLEDAGYTVSESGADFTMAVQLSELRYARESGTMSSEVQVVAELALRISDSRGNLERSYRSASNQTRVTRPSAEDNKMFLEEALNSSVDRLIRDNRVHTFLRR
ncbi:MAG: YajG family lipoprotein [Natronospirillum sp.]|uniref:YajG family lipoprotein n=1 Tax=Natronospirillum sp. TaxID=2812955 RepID=UPI0025DBAF2B|nr:YajG family lipoprotein [Natronospirillum sp.]MCH8550660.1 YajG family lipoprotein [Natronospirillum sp.]